MFDWTSDGKIPAIGGVADGERFDAKREFFNIGRMPDLDVTNMSAEYTEDTVVETTTYIRKHIANKFYVFVAEDGEHKSWESVLIALIEGYRK